MKINVDLIYPIGSLYLTTSTISPAVLFGGTWERLTADAYLKIVNNELELGELGGTSSDHKIPLTSIPSHTHRIPKGNWEASVSGKGIVIHNYNGGERMDSGASGGGQPYYPYYYGIYVWKRTA